MIWYRLVRGARDLWRRSAPARLREALGPLVSPLAARTLLWGAGARKVRASRSGPIVVSSFFGEVLGIGRAGELTAAQLEQAGYEVVRHDLRPVIEAPPYAAMALPGSPDGVWVLHCNPIEAHAVMARLHRRDWDRRLRIGYWAWELARAPESWRRLSSYFHQIWTPSGFTGVSLGDVGRPVIVMPHPVPAPRAKRDPARFGLDPARTHVLAMADLRSTAARKNPRGALDLFLRLFPDPQDQVVLLLKVTALSHDPAAAEELEAIARQRRDVVLLTSTLSADDMNDLLASVDVLLSLHRAEGFGLPVAEALALGTPVLATGWSGVLTFMEGLDDLLVGYELVPVPEETPHYGGMGERWAEPDLADAERKLRRLLVDPALRERTAAEGRARVAALKEAWTPERLVAIGLPPPHRGSAAVSLMAEPPGRS